MTRTVAHDTFVIERHYPASPKRVFAAFADPALKTQWFGEPGADSQYELDFRVGGRESLRGQAPNGGPAYLLISVYQDIVENERIVYSYEMTMDGRRISVSVATVELLGEDGGTKFTLTEQGAYLDGLDASAIREQGTHELMDALGRFLDASADA
jgi:uncharacterized protein YndB with AHSA1/START domain